MKKFEFITSLGIVALFFFVGCGEDDDAGKTGVAPETKAVEFTSTEISSFCAWVL